MGEDDTINEVEVFRTTDELTARVAVDEVLAPAGIEATIHNRTSHAFPAPAAMPGGYFIAVAERDARAVAVEREPAGRRAARAIEGGGPVRARLIGLEPAAFDARDRVDGLHPEERHLGTEAEHVARHRPLVTVEIVDLGLAARAVAL